MALLFPDVNEKNELNQGLSKGKRENSDNRNLDIEVKKFGTDNNKISCKGQ